MLLNIKNAFFSLLFRKTNDKKKLNLEPIGWKQFTVNRFTRSKVLNYSTVLFYFFFLKSLLLIVYYLLGNILNSTIIFKINFSHLFKLYYIL